LFCVLFLKKKEKTTININNPQHEITHQKIKTIFIYLFIFTLHQQFFFFFFFKIKKKITTIKKIIKHINKDIICWTEGIRITQIREKLLSVRRGSIIMLLNALEKEKEGRK
jgi:ribonucleotide reductase beta subunit family protein with ferritin-like domain